MLPGLDRLATSRITYVEVRAGIAARRRSRRLSRRGATGAREQLEARWPALDVIELSPPVAGAAGAAAERYGLRAHDAIQLASALLLEERDTVVVTLDDRLRRASRAAGLAVAP